jgi:NADH dehydrogenase FAD-containing subunit
MNERKKTQETRLVVLGGGFGGLYAALYLDKTIVADPNESA